MDERDHLLIEHLIKNPRAKLSHLAGKIGISVTAVSKRLLRLEKEEYIKYKVAINTNKVKTSRALMLIETKDSVSRTTIIDRFNQCSLVDQIFDIIGWEFHILISINSFDSALINNFMTYCPINYYEGIKRVISLPVISDMRHPSFLPISSKNFGQNIENCGTNCEKDCDRFHKGCPGCPTISVLKLTETE
ncbi:MAG: Lrp/AsnC family transcriptional regulator [Candidatus Hodarchaeales archaeon]|jgi:DNA-binding Lrp family transcriptional regulator